ncbi:MAG TPA: diguanylate cyclase [Capillimicrobium sp.]
MRDAPNIRRARARPVADAPVAALVADADELARDWLLALMATAPLEELGRVPAGELAARGPALCRAMARALADDEALDALADDPLAARAGRLAGADAPADAAQAVEALRGVLWTAALAALARPEPTLVAALADRLAAVAATVTAAALAAPREPRAAWPPAAPAASEPEPAPPEPQDAPPELRARDLRPRIVDGDHLEALEQAVAAHRADRRTLAVLLVELDGVDRLLAADLGGEVAAAVQRAEEAVETLLRPGDAARREGPGRVWLLLAGTGPAGARALALRAAASVEREADHRGTPLTASVGVAVFPVDAIDARTLAERTEDALFTARAAGSRGAPPPPLGLR